MIKSRRENKIKFKTPTDVAFSVVITVLMSLFAISFIFVLFWMVISSFRTYVSYNNAPNSMFNFSGTTFKNLFENYKTVLSYSTTTLVIVNGERVRKTLNIFTMLKNSFLQMAIAVIFSFIFPPAVGYVISKYKFKGKKLIVTAVVSTMCIPSIGTTVAVLSFYDKLNVINTWWPVILSSSGGLGYGVLLYGNYFAAIPWEYVESAKLDGASDLTSYVRIMFPQVLPILLAHIILAIISVWNDYMTCYLYMPKNMTIAYGVSRISSEYSDRYPIVFAALTMTTMFTLIIYSCFSKTILSSMSEGGVKG